MLKDIICILSIKRKEIKNKLGLIQICIQCLVWIMECQNFKKLWGKKIKRVYLNLLIINFLWKKIMKISNKKTFFVIIVQNSMKEE